MFQVAAVRVTEADRAEAAAASSAAIGVIGLDKLAFCWSPISKEPAQPDSPPSRQELSLAPKCTDTSAFVAAAGSPAPVAAAVSSCGILQPGDEELFLQQLARRARLLHSTFRSRVLGLIESRATPRRTASGGTSELKGGSSTGCRSLRRSTSALVKVVECCFDEGVTGTVEVLPFCSL